MKSREINLFSTLITVQIREFLSNPFRLWAEVTITLSRCGLLLFLFSSVFKEKGGVIAGVGFAATAWSVFLYFSCSSLKIRMLSQKMMEDIKSGNVEIYLNKPISYLFFRGAYQVAEGLPTFFILNTVYLVLMLYFVGLPPNFNLTFFLPTLAIVYLFSHFLAILLYSIVGLMSFWIEDINPLFWIIDKMVMILGGSYLPISLFPPFLYKIAIYSPLGATMFVSHTVYDNWGERYLLLISLQTFWLFALGFLTYLLFSAALKKVSVNGG
jgi:ABC-2 type transport system permease protein